MKPITYIKGDVRNPLSYGNKILIHCCNDIGAFGAGVAEAIKQKWPIVREEYLKWVDGKLTYKPFKLGQVQFVKVENNLIVANMIGQHGIGHKNGIAPIRYDAIDECLKNVSDIALKYKASIHAPKFGAGLAGGDWVRIEALVIKNLCEKNIDVCVYELN
jgi:O-acetyl-ADP-ribose deacetylase (regulator of RNase III)